MKFKIILIALGMFAAPVLAAETTKGAKSYQSRSEKLPEAPAATTDGQKAEDAANIAPAAGDAETAEKSAGEGKSWREEMRLPRKN